MQCGLGQVDAKICNMATAEHRPRLEVRPARAEDAPAMREIFNEAVEDGLATFQSVARSMDEQQRLIAAAEQDPLQTILVGEVRNWVCGLVAIEPHDRRRLDHVGEVVVFVRRSFRSYGVGRQLMRAAQSEAVRLGYRKLIGQILAENSESVRLCQATGWRVVGQLEQHVLHGGKLRDVVVVEYLVPAGQPVE